MPDTYAQALATANEALSKGDARQAWTAFRAQLEHPGGLAAPEQWEEGLEVLARIAESLVNAEFASLVRDTSRTYNDPHALLDLGNALIEKGLPGVAATVLSRANALSPGRVPILDGLVFSLLACDRAEEACRVLRETGRAVEESFLLEYLLCFCAILSRDLAEPARRVQRLLAAAQNPKSSEWPYMANTIAGMLARAEAVRQATRLDEDDLRGWHFVLNGTLLLHLSPHGLHEGMRGRYALVQDTVALCHEGILRLKALLEAIGAKPPRVLLLPDRSSDVLGRATAEALSLPVEPWPQGGSKEPGLVVAYDLPSVAEPVRATLGEYAPGQHLWVHASCWTERGPFAADVMTFLHQAARTPWEEKEGDLPKAILGAKVDSAALADVPDLIALARAACAMQVRQGPGLVRTEGRRRRLWVESPVKSNRFR